jgi:hypothetical protein
MLTDAAQIRIDGGNATAEQKEHVQKENAVDLVTETDEGKVIIKLYRLLFQIVNKLLSKHVIGLIICKVCVHIRSDQTLMVRRC